MSDYNLSTPPPSCLFLCENGSQYAAVIGGAQGPVNAALAAQTVAFLQQWFGRSFSVTSAICDWNGNGNPNEMYVLEGEQCLVFYLGGIPISTASGVSMTGFSPNVVVSPANPMGPATPASAGTQRKGPYFNFNPARLRPVGSFPVYVDDWSIKTPKPYAFFSSAGKINGYNPVTSAVGGDCASIAAWPYFEMTAAGTANFTNNNTYQIISAGKDVMFGTATNGSIRGIPRAA